MSNYSLIHWSKVLVGGAGRENLILCSWTDVYCYIIYIYALQQRVENYCCLQFSFFSLGFERADLSVCRFVGGMKAGSSSSSCKPGCGIGSD